MRSTLKSVQLELSIPELNERQAHLRKNQSLELYHWRKALQPVVTLVGSRVAQTCMGESIFATLRQQQGWGQKKARFHPEHLDGRRNRFLR